MKRKSLLLMLLMALFAPWTAKAQETPRATTATLPWSENFSSTSWPSDWYRPVTYDGKPVIQNYSWGAYSAPYCLELRAKSGSPNMVILPQFNQPLNTLTISFKYGRGNTQGGYSVKLGYVTSTSATSLTGELTTIAEPVKVNNHSDFSFTVPSSAPSGTNYRLAIYFTRTNSTADSWYFDNFSVTYTAPAVPTPITMQCGTNYSGTLGTSGIWNSYPTSSCGWTENGEEKVYAYTPPVTGSYTFYTTNDVGDTDFFLMTSNSNNGTSVGCWSSGEASYTLTGGQTYYLICDNCTGSSSVTYSVQVSCPTCSVTVWTDGGGTASGSGSYTYNTSCTATATPSSGYVFDRWILNGTQTITTNPYTFTVTGATDLQAVFSTAHSITVSANPSNGGSASGGGTFTSGESCTVTATPNGGYCFNNWTENGTAVSTNATYTFTVSGNRNLVANFVSVDANSITVSGTSVACGNSTTLTASGLTGVTYNWYSDAACTQLVQENSATLTTPALTENTTYYVKAVGGTSLVEQKTTFSYTGSAQTYNVPANATKLELEVWGAQGGDNTYGGKGGYSVGMLNNLNGISNLYVYVGQQPTSTTGGWNGGGGYTSYGSSGGGATDISLHNNTYNTSSHYNDRIIVAGGGGGKGYSSTYGGAGGGVSGIVGGAGSATGGGGGTQTSGGTSSSLAGMFGCANTSSSHNGGGGGGGWYGGGSGTSSGTDSGGGGGSGYVWTSATSSSVPSGYNVSSSYYLTEAQTIAGNATMPNPDGGEMTGREGNGYARITAYINEACESEAKAVTVTVTNTCPTPTNLQCTYYNRTSATLAWTAGGDEEAWQVKYWPTNQTEPGDLDGNTMNVSTNPYTLTNLTQGQTYYVKVRAKCDENDFSDWSTAITVTPQALTYLFTNNGGNGDGQWNTLDNWQYSNPSITVTTLPTINDNVQINAACTIPTNCTAQANEITFLTDQGTVYGSITIEDGGQLQHSNTGVNLTIQRNIDAYQEANALTNLGYKIISFPVSGLAPTNSSIRGLITDSNNPYDFYTFDYMNQNQEDGSYLEWVKVIGNYDTDGMEPTTGYLYASQNGTTISVTGEVAPSSANVTHPLSAVTGDEPFNGWYLMGNPFVCNAYLTANGGNLDFYEIEDHTQAGYADFVLNDNTVAIPPMGGVMVRVKANDNLVYSRTAPNSKGPGILNMDVNKLIATRDGASTETIDRARLRFGQGRNLEKLQLNPRHTKLYIPDGSKDYAVVYAEPAGEMPVNFKAENNGHYTLSFCNDEVNFNYLHLIDNMTGADIDLLETPSYSFEAKTTDYESRFKLVFATGEGSDDDNFAFFSNGTYVINNDGDATLQIVDVMGRILSSENISGSTSKAINVAPGVYMLRLINGDKAKVQKIVVR